MFLRDKTADFSELFVKVCKRKRKVFVLDKNIVGNFYRRRRKTPNCSDIALNHNIRNFLCRSFRNGYNAYSYIVFKTEAFKFADRKSVGRERVF